MKKYKDLKEQIDEDQAAFDNYMSQGDDVSPLEDKEPEPFSDEGDKKPKDEVQSSTFEHFQERLDELVEKETTNVYFNVPNAVDLNVGVVDYKVVHNKIDEFYKSMDNSDQWRHYTPENFNALKKYIYENGYKLSLIHI